MFFISSFYRFAPIGDLEGLRSALVRYAEGAQLLGLVILAPEGLNATLAGTERAVRGGIEVMRQFLDLAEILFKESSSERAPFSKFVVKVREEIVTIGESCPVSEGAFTLDPARWHSMLSSGQDVVLLDTRNDYEVAVGKFRGAINPEIENFADFPEYVARSGIPKESTVLMYCTGGIRCEKAVQIMRRAGYGDVYHLRGGILGYLERFPNEHFEGECFVFDDRVAVTQHLTPSTTYAFCPLCGAPASRSITCEICGVDARLCEECLESGKRRCSLRCANDPKHEILSRDSEVS